MELLVQGQNISLRIDGGQTRQMANRGDSLYLKVNSSLFIGGISQDLAPHALRYWHLRNASSFVGKYCK